MSTERVSVEDFLPAVIAWAHLDGSAKASRVGLMASDLLDRSGATETCLARAMGYTGPMYLAQGENKALSMAEDIVSRAAAALQIDPVDVALVAAGLTATRRILRGSGGLRGHDGCATALTVGSRAPRSISERVQ